MKSNEISIQSEKSNISKIVESSEIKSRVQLLCLGSEQKSKFLIAQFQNLLKASQNSEGKSKLHLCTPQSLGSAFLSTVELGLTVGGPTPLAYLIPYAKGDQTYCSLQISYRGYLLLARRAGISVFAKEVIEGDFFQCEFGLTPVLKHTPHFCATASESTITHFYAVATASDGLKVFDVFSKNQMLEHREKYSAQYRGWAQRQNRGGDPPLWVKEFCAMGKKTAIKSLISHSLPLGFEENEKIKYAFDSDGRVFDETKKDKSEFLSEEWVEPDCAPEQAPGKNSDFAAMLENKKN